MKLTQTQRNYMLKEFVQAMLGQAKKEVKKKKLPPLLNANRTEIVFRDYYHDTPRFEIYSQIDTTRITDSDLKHSVSNNITLNKEWWQKQIAEGNYTVDIEFSECMTYPRTTLIWTNEEKQRELEFKKQMKNARKLYNKAKEDISDLKRIVLDMNKAYKEAERNIMLLDNEKAYKFFDSLIKSVNEIVK